MLKLLFGEVEIVRWETVEDQLDTAMTYCNEIRQAIVQMLGDWFAESADFLQCIWNAVN